MNPEDALDALTDVGDDQVETEPEDTEEPEAPAEAEGDTEDKGKPTEDDEYKTYDNLDEANAKIRAQQFGVLNLQAEMAQKEREHSQLKSFMDELDKAETPQEALRSVAQVIAQRSGVSVDELLSTQSKQKSDYTGPDFESQCESPADAALAKVTHEASVGYTDKAVAEMEARIMSKIGKYEPHLEGFVKESQTRQQVEKIRSEVEPVARLLVGEFKLKPETVAAWGGFTPTLEQAMDAATKHSYLLERANTVEEKKKALTNAVMFEFKDTHIKDAILGKKPAKKGPGGPNAKSDTRMPAHDISAQGRVGRRASELSKRILAGQVD